MNLNELHNLKDLGISIEEYELKQKYSSNYMKLSDQLNEQIDSKYNKRFKVITITQNKINLGLTFKDNTTDKVYLMDDVNLPNIHNTIKR